MESGSPSNPIVISDDEGEDDAQSSSDMRSTMAQACDAGGARVVAREAPAIGSETRPVDMESECAICREPLLNGETIVTCIGYACKNEFHESCALRWKEVSNRCPMCKMNNFI